ncbi:MAG: toll/interleukin-1 receptor domain-containing protein [Acidobacteria bacterium]|nr:toll/interleukin-1 receptor domain-containing protein [Acidobacteriota bacterium]
MFLSHAYTDRELVLGLALMIEDLGYSVYIDWRDDPHLDRSKVTPETAAKLKARMKVSRCLLYSTTSNASDSKWMPWELGFKDGDNTRAAILPVVQYSTTTYQGQEYLGVYPYVDAGNDRTGKRRLWVCRSSTCYVDFDSWLEGSEPAERG